MIDESNVVGDGGGAINVQKDVPLFTQPNGKAFGQNYWTAPDSDTYDGVRLGRKNTNVGIHLSARQNGPRECQHTLRKILKVVC